MAKILLAEDSGFAASTLAGTLRNLGHEVHLAKDGDEVVTKFPQTRPDLLVLDYRMPGIDGLDAVRKIRQLPGGQEVPVLFVSARSLDGVPGFEPSPLTRTLTKPAGKDELHAAIAELLPKGR